MGTNIKVKMEFFDLLKSEGTIPIKNIERLELLMSNLDNFSESDFDNFLNEMVIDED